MTINQIKKELAKMSEEQQDQLAAYVVLLRHLRNPESRKEIAARIDDRDPPHWMTLDQLTPHWKE